MTDEETKQGDADGRYNRMAVGIALGIPFGVLPLRRVRTARALSWS